MPRDGSLLHHLLRAHNKETGRPFTEHQIMAQGNTFLLAGGHMQPDDGYNIGNPVPSQIHESANLYRLHSTSVCSTVLGYASYAATRWTA